MSHIKSIILVDDEDFFRNRLIKAFTRRGFTTFGAANYDEAIAIVKDNRPQLAVVDLKMPGKTGIELIKDVRTVAPAMKIVVLTGYGSIATAIDAVKLGAQAYISKPADVEEILMAFNDTNAPKTDGADNLNSIPVPSLARTEWEHINRVLADCGGNISQTAQKLGIHRRSLQRKLQKYPPKT